MVDEDLHILLKPTSFGEDAAGYDKLRKLLGEVGDCLVVMEATGHYGRNLQATLAVAQGGIQMGRAAALNIRRDLLGRTREPFTYRNRGDLAVIGRYRAIAQFPRLALSGVLAWLLWLFVHIMYLAGFRNRASVLLQWGYAFFTWQRGVRLILQDEGRGSAGAT